MPREERRRVSKEQVRQNAKQGGGGGQNWFNLPDGVETWVPEKANRYRLNFLPYVVKSEKHPDGNIRPGDVWYKYPFQVHHGVGPEQKSVVCPVSVGKKCPLCEEKARLAKDYDNNKEAIKAVNPQKYMAFVIQHPDDDEKVAVFAMSVGKFWGADAGLEKELKETDEANLNFYDVTNGDGKTVVARFSDADYQGRKYIECTRIDFEEREDMDEDDVFGKVPCLDEIFNVMPYEKLNALFYQLDDSENGDGKGKDSGDSESPPSRTAGGLKAGKTTASGKPTKQKAPEPDDENDDDDDEPVQKLADIKSGGKKPKFKEGDRVTFTNDDDEEITGKIIDIDDDDVEVEDDDGETHDTMLAKLKPAPEKSTKPEKAKPEAKSKAAEKKPAAAKPAPAAPKAPKFKVGDKVKDDEGVTGTITAIDEDTDQVTCKGKGGITFDVDIDDIELVESADAGDSSDDEDEDEDESPAEFEPGDDVTWEDDEGDDQEGEVVKLKDGKALVKNAAGKSWVDVDELTKA